MQAQALIGPRAKEYAPYTQEDVRQYARGCIEIARHFDDNGVRHMVVPLRGAQPIARGVIYALKYINPEVKPSIYYIPTSSCLASTLGVEYMLDNARRDMNVDRSEGEAPNPVIDVGLIDEIKTGPTILRMHRRVNRSLNGPFRDRDVGKHKHFDFVFGVKYRLHPAALMDANGALVAPNMFIELSRIGVKLCPVDRLITLDNPPLLGTGYVERTDNASLFDPDVFPMMEHRSTSMKFIVELQENIALQMRG